MWAHAGCIKPDGRHLPRQVLGKWQESWGMYVKLVHTFKNSVFKSS